MTVDFAAETPETQAEPTGPSIIYTAYFSAVEELVEHMRAADVLNLGFRVESYLVTSEEAPDTIQVEFEFTLLSEQPTREEERD
ncbi:hypothetical protein AB0M46_47155 [Dactylosporangium sp. NPDC051485]|uniref:hypothetical protein n=1 Tax=Dactylosporangium sp. NPDC051485 TaxID=3154846 RepID=UPI00341504C9